MKMPPKKESSGDKNKSNANLKIRLIREYNKKKKKLCSLLVKKKNTHV